MPDANDMELLGDYARNGSEEAFAELVRRHLPLVYSAALRQIGMAAQAEEITQAVFIILARKAGSVRPGTILEGWLYETTRLTALRFLRGERRRHFREQEVYMQSTLRETNENSAWEEISPLLDEALARLGKKDRDAVILRFFKEKSVREVAATMQMQEAAAQRRILRALEKLRKFFSKRGVISTTAIIATAISANSVQATPMGLAKTVSAVAVAKGAAVSASTLTLIKGALKVMAWTKMKSIAVAGVIVVLATTTISLEIRHEWRARHLASVAAINNGDPSQQGLQGRWTGSNTAHPGRTCTLSISGNQIEYRGADPNDWLRGTFVLNGNTDPKQLDITILEPVRSFVIGIYEVTGDKITIAAAPHGSNQRPVDFTPGPRVDVLECARN